MNVSGSAVVVDPGRVPPDDLLDVAFMIGQRGKGLAKQWG